VNKIAVILSGLGYEKGTSIFEIPFVLRMLEKRGMIPQPAVPSEVFTGGIGFLSKDPSIRKDVEGVFDDKVFTIPELSAKDLDGLIVLGGRGSLTILSDFAKKEENAQVNPQFMEMVRAFTIRKKPIGLLGYATVPVVLSMKKIENSPIVSCGGDPRIQDILESLGAMVINTTADNVVIDEENLLFSSHGIVPASSIYRASLGIEQVVNALVETVLEKNKK